MPNFVLAEVNEGQVYMLTSHGEVWRMKMGDDLQPLIEKLDHIGYDTAKWMMSPIFNKWLS